MKQEKQKCERPQCLFQHTDCFAWMQGNRCFCLDNTDFKERDECPFYKNNMREYGLKYLIEKYREEKKYERNSLEETDQP